MSKMLVKIHKKNGKLRNKIRYKCNLCLHQWQEKSGKRISYKRYYFEWLIKRRTLTDISSMLDISVPKLTHEFDKIHIPEGVQYPAPKHAISLLIDATFFGRNFGFLCFHDTNKIIYFREIKTETVRALRGGLYELLGAGYKIKSVTIDGRIGYYDNIKNCLGPCPCKCACFIKSNCAQIHYRQTKIRLRTRAKRLMTRLCTADTGDFIDDFYRLKMAHQSFLDERNNQGDFLHKDLRAAFKSLQENLHKLFTYKDIPVLKIPSTTNYLEGTFSHLKEKTKLHRGLRPKRLKTAVKFILKNTQNSITNF